jgi:hypothetical protein
MGANKDEILKNAEKAAELERQRKELDKRDDKPLKMTSRMPLGCWFWILGGIAVAFWLLKKYGLGL